MVSLFPKGACVADQNEGSCFVFEGQPPFWVKLARKIPLNSFWVTSALTELGVLYATGNCQ